MHALAIFKRKPFYDLSKIRKYAELEKEFEKLEKTLKTKTF